MVLKDYIRFSGVFCGLIINLVVLKRLWKKVFCIRILRCVVVGRVGRSLTWFVRQKGVLEEAAWR